MSNYSYSYRDEFADEIQYSFQHDPFETSITIQIHTTQRIKEIVEEDHEESGASKLGDSSAMLEDTTHGISTFEE